MSNPVVMCNLGIVSKLGAGAITSLTPPRSTLEKLCAQFYDKWRQQELSKKRWVFATEFLPLALLGTLTGTTTDERLLARPYYFQLPTNVLRPIPQKYQRWARRGDKLYSDEQTLTIEAIVDKTEDQFDPLFEDVLAWRIAQELAEPATQSNTKKQLADAGYKEALATAARNNAYQLEPETHDASDESYSWLTARDGYV
jgi:hypothetical protein